jgi:hypothetical protein
MPWDQGPGLRCPGALVRISVDKATCCEPGFASK